MLFAQFSFQTIKRSDNAFPGFDFDEHDMLIAGDSLGNDKKCFLSSSGSYNQIHFMMTCFVSRIDDFRAIINTFSFKVLMFSTRRLTFCLSPAVTTMW